MLVQAVLPLVPRAPPRLAGMVRATLGRRSLEPAFGQPRAVAASEPSSEASAAADALVASALAVVLAAKADTGGAGICEHGTVRTRCRNAIGHQHRMHCASSCPGFFLAVIGQERARVYAAHELIVIVIVHLPRLHWAGTRSTGFDRQTSRGSTGSCCSRPFCRRTAHQSLSHILGGSPQ